MTKTRRSTHVRILQATSEVVLSKGIQAATVQDILKAAGVCRRTFYQYFPNKESVLEGLYRTMATDRLVAKIDSAIASTTEPFAKVLVTIDAFLEFEREGGRLLVLLQSEALRGDSPLSTARLEVLDALVLRIEQTVQQELGVSFDPLIYRTLFLGIEGLLVHEQRSGVLDDAGMHRIRGIIRPMVISIFASAPHLPTV
jgi:AcrR family transcriptional regulator